MFRRQTVIPLFRSALSLFCVFLLIVPKASAQKLPTGFKTVQIATGLLKPTAMAFAPDGRIFVAEQSGTIRVIKNGVMLATPFIKFRVSLRGEGGLLGMAFDPDFETNRYIYLYYTVPNESVNKIGRFVANGDVVLAGSEKVIWTSDSLSATIHHGGSLRFKDGKLYAATGDSSNPNAAANLNSSHGKVIRINPDGSIPAGNPYNFGTAQTKRIWASGFRNPFSFDVDPATGKIFVNDVGYNKWEEINDVTVSGKNFGWPEAEGNSTNGGLTNSAFTYNHGHNDEFGCAITGGAFFNPAQTNYPSGYLGKYFFMDYCAQFIRTLSFSNGTAVVENFASALGTGTLAISVGNDGNLYYILRSTGSVYKIIYSTNDAPAIARQPISVTVSETRPATFSVSATGKDPLTYQWFKDNIAIPGATAETFTIAETKIADSGYYKVKISNSAGSVTSSVARLTVTAYNSQPVAVMVTPQEGTLYRAGEPITFSGTATDQEDGALAASRFTWYVDFYHDTHNHAGPPAATGVKSGSYIVPTRGETSDTVWYKVTLIVTDSKGLADTVSTDVHPRKSNVTLRTEPGGLQVKLDGQAIKTGYSFSGVEMVERSIGIVSPQTLNGKTYQFTKWQHGGPADQVISTPVNDSTFTAIFTEVAPTSTEFVNGLDYKYFEGKWTMIPDFNALTAVKEGSVSNFSLANQNRPDQFAFQFKGFIEIPADGEYTLFTQSDDGSNLYIGSTRVVNNDGLHSLREMSGKIILTKGKHPITVDYLEGSGGNYLYVRWAGPGIAKTLVPPSALYRSTGTPQEDRSTVTLQTSPAGLKVKVDANTVTSPFVYTEVKGVSRTVSPLSPQTFNGKSYEFSHWIHGGAADQTIVTPSSDTAFTAVFKEVVQPSTEFVNGLDYKYYEGKWSVIPNTTLLTPTETGIVSYFDLSPQNRPDQFIFQFSGYIDLPSDGEYTFFTSSDDGSKLYIGSTLVVNNDGLHSLREALGKITLVKGKHPIRVEYLEGTGSATLYVRYAGPGIAKVNIPPSALFRSTAEGGQTLYAASATQTHFFSIHPNPADQEVNVEVSARQNETITVSIRSDSQGIVLQKSQVAAEGLNRISLDTSALPIGIYYLECKTPSVFQRERLVIE